MKKKFRYSLMMATALGLAGISYTCRAQVDTAGKAVLPAANDTLAHRQVAIFAPLYLDSAFDASGNYRYDKTFPKFINPGLEFYEGAQLALDSLKQEIKSPQGLDIQVYDSHSASQTMQQMLESPAFQRTELILGQVTSAAELQQLAAAAALKGIPFVNVNFPNDGGIANNPNFVILNSTLRTHCEGIYRYVQRNYPTKSLVFFRKKGPQEDRLRGYFNDIEKNTNSVPLKIRYITLEDNFETSVLTSYLDSTAQTVCIAGSLDEVFATRLCEQLAGLSRTYRTTVIGMPTWDNIDFTRPEYMGEEIIYSTPFYNNPADSLATRMQQNFKNKFYSRPSDMFFRGYETTYRFAKLLLEQGSRLGGSIGEKKFKVFNDFDIEPVLNHQTMTLDYFENKKLYFIKKMDGSVTAVN